MTKREARRWVREHWQAFMRSADMPDTRDMSEADAMAIFDVWTDESLRLADRLEAPRRIPRDDPRVRFVPDAEGASARVSDEHRNGEDRASGLSRAAMPARFGEAEDAHPSPSPSMPARPDAGGGRPS